MILTVNTIGDFHSTTILKENSNSFITAKAKFLF